MGRRLGGRVGERICLRQVSTRPPVSPAEGRTLRWLRRVLCEVVSSAFAGGCIVAKLTIRKYDLKLEQTALPDCPIFARYRTVPLLEVEGALWCLHGPRYEAKRVISTPLLAGTSQHCMLLYPRLLPYRSSCSRAVVSDMLGDVRTGCGGVQVGVVRCGCAVEVEVEGRRTRRLLKGFTVA